PKTIYWWLAFVPNNILLLCQSCTVSKRDQFPIRGERASIGTMGADLDAEEPLLLNPYTDHPEDHIRFDTSWWGCSPTTDRGGATVERLNLNREDLIYQRRQFCESPWFRLLNTFNTGDIHTFRRVVTGAMSGAEPYSAFLREYVKEQMARI